MFNTEETYRPVNIQFDVATDDTIVPETLGKCDTEEEVNGLLSNVTAVNQSLTVCRHMDNLEKTQLRENYNEILEIVLPRHEKELVQATQVLEQAKKAEKEAKERVNAAMSEVKGLAYQVKRGLVEMQLDDKYTHRIPYHGRYYFFTYIDQELKLCKIQDIPEHEKGELYNAMAKNDEFFDTNFGNGSTES